MLTRRKPTVFFTRRLTRIDPSPHFSRAVIILAAASLLLVAGCDGLNPYKIGERSISRYLRDSLGPSRNYKVRIHKEGTRLRGGYISHLTVAADDLTTKSGFQIRRLDADL